MSAATALQEFTTASPNVLRVDRDAGILRGVKLLGFTSSNGRRYLNSALREAAPLYEGAKVNVNHASAAQGGPVAPREYQDRLGVIRNVALRENEGLFGDLHFNPKHALAEQLIWDAEHAPQNVGLSHNVLAHTAARGEETIVERIENVVSVDLVADPATTRGLFESGMENPQSPVKESRDDSASTPQSELRIPDSQEFRARAGRICALLAEFALPLPGAPGADARRITSDAFLDELWQAPDDDALRQQVQDRAALVEAARNWGQAAGGARATVGHAPDLQNGAAHPTSRDQFAAALAAVPVAPQNAEAFAEAITA